VPAGRRADGRFVKKTRPIEDIVQPQTHCSTRVQLQPEYADRAREAAHVDGPYRTTGRGTIPSRAKIFVCEPKRRARRRLRAEILSTPRTCLRRSRRPSTSRCQSTSTGKARAGGDSTRVARLRCKRVLSSPQFVFRFERDPPGGRPRGRIRSPIRARVAARVLPVDSIPETSCSSRRGTRLSKPPFCAAGARNARRFAPQTALTKNFRGPMALSAQPRHQRRVDPSSSRLRRQPRNSFRRRPRCYSTTVPHAASS